jgi:predicted small secreted protein
MSDGLMRRVVEIAIAVAIVAALLAGCTPGVGGTTQGSATSSDAAIARAFDTRATGAQVEDEGVVTRVLSDDLEGQRHQRFILRLDSGQTVLVAHNIGIAPRVEGLKPGDSVKFSGEYEWNAQGGVIHWTHHDPGGHHRAGWLQHGGETYQ